MEAKGGIGYHSSVPENSALKYDDNANTQRVASSDDRVELVDIDARLPTSDKGLAENSVDGAIVGVVDGSVDGAIGGPVNTSITGSVVAKQSKSGLTEKLTQELSDKPVPSTAQPALFILGNDVPAGTSARLDWTPGSSFIGIATPTAVLALNGVRKGPTLCITAAVHGDELNGIEVVRRLMYDIMPSELSGAIIGVPIVNVEGFRRSSRYLPDRRDLNRFFPGNPKGSSASRIAHSFFTEVVSHCDMLIDLHTGSFGRTNLPQLRANLIDPAVANLSRKMGSIVVLQSKGAAGSLRRAATERGVPSVTLEAGAPHELQKKAVDHSVKSIETAMDNLGMINRRRFWERAVEPVYYKSTWVRAREGGILFSSVSLGANVHAGDVLGVVTDPITNRSVKIRAPFDGRIIGMALNQVLNPGFAVFHIGLKASVEDAAQDVTLDEVAAKGMPETGDDVALGVDVNGRADAGQPLTPLDVSASYLDGGQIGEQPQDTRLLEGIDFTPLEDSD